MDRVAGPANRVSRGAEVPPDHAGRRVAIRALVMPVEHGGWSLLLEPIVLALVVLPSSAGVLVALAAVCAFLTRQPLNLAVRDYRRNRRFPRTAVCERLVLIFAAGIAASFLWPGLQTGGGALMPMLLASPLLGIVILYDVRAIGRALIPEIAAATMVGAVGASIILAGHGRASLAYVLWAVTTCRAVPAVIHVRTSLGRGSFASSLFLHLGAVLVATMLCSTGVLPVAAVFAMLVLLGRALFSIQLRRVSAKRIGLTELTLGVLTVAIVAAGFLLQ